VNRTRRLSRRTVDRAVFLVFVAATLMPLGPAFRSPSVQRWAEAHEYYGFGRAYRQLFLLPFVVTIVVLVGTLGACVHSLTVERDHLRRGRIVGVLALAVVIACLLVAPMFDASLAWNGRWSLIAAVTLVVSTVGLLVGRAGSRSVPLMLAASFFVLASVDSAFRGTFVFNCLGETVPASAVASHFLDVLPTQAAAAAACAAAFVFARPGAARRDRWSIAVATLLVTFGLGRAIYAFVAHEIHVGHQDPSVIDRLALVGDAIDTIGFAAVALASLRAAGTRAIDPCPRRRREPIALAVVLCVVFGVDRPLVAWLRQEWVHAFWREAPEVDVMTSAPAEFERPTAMSDAFVAFVRNVGGPTTLFAGSTRRVLAEDERIGKSDPNETIFVALAANATATDVEAVIRQAGMARRLEFVSLTNRFESLQPRSRRRFPLADYVGRSVRVSSIAIAADAPALLRNEEFCRGGSATWDAAGRLAMHVDCGAPFQLELLGGPASAPAATLLREFERAGVWRRPSIETGRLVAVYKPDEPRESPDQSAWTLGRSPSIALGFLGLAAAATTLDRWRRSRVVRRGAHRLWLVRRALVARWMLFAIVVAGVLGLPDFWSFTVSGPLNHLLWTLKNLLP